MSQFTASTSTGVKIITVLMIALAVFFAGWAVRDKDAVLLVPVVVLLFVIGLSFYYSIRGYEIADGRVTIRRPFDSVSLPIADLNAEIVERKDLRWTIRTFGIGGLFSYTGEFWNKKFGSMTWYVTRMDRVILLTDSRSKKIAISPDDRENFIRSLKN